MEDRSEVKQDVDQAQSKSNYVVEAVTFTAGLVKNMIPARLRMSSAQEGEEPNKDGGDQKVGSGSGVGSDWEDIDEEVSPSIYLWSWA